MVTIEQYLNVRSWLDGCRRPLLVTHRRPDGDALGAVAAMALALRTLQQNPLPALFEPLLAMSRDEALTGLARGFAFRLVENLGVIPRESIATEVKELDQDARGHAQQHPQGQVFLKKADAALFLFHHASDAIK